MYMQYIEKMHWHLQYVFFGGWSVYINTTYTTTCVPSFNFNVQLCINHELTGHYAHISMGPEPTARTYGAALSKRHRE